MVTVINIEINIFALSILFVIYMSLRHRSGGDLIDNKLFLMLLGSNALSLALNILLSVVDRKPGIIARDANLILNAAAFILTTIILIMWSLYARYQVLRDENKTRKVLALLIIPACISAIITILSLFKGYYFFIDASNHYHRGNFFKFYGLLCIVYVLYTQIFIITNKRRITRKYFIPLAIFALPPFICGVLQMLFYGISTVWIGMTVSSLIISMNVQNDQLYTDYLTGLSNRRQLDRYLQEYTRRYGRKKLLAGIMIDLDYFKHINDTWGHLAGDEALVYASKILEMSFRSDDLICRYGGDEFIVIFEVRRRSDLIRAVNRVKRNVQKFQEQDLTPYKINLSMGYDVFDLRLGIDVRQFLRHLDSLMYENKKDRGRLVNPRIRN